MAIIPGPNEKYPFKIECGRPNCFFHVLMPTYEQAKLWDDPKQHKCPRGVDTSVGASLTHSLLEKSWIELDAVVAELMTHKEKGTAATDSDLVFLRGKASGIAEVLGIFMVPHFRTANEVSRESLRRWKMIQAGEAPETPGVGSLKYTFPEDSKYKRMEAREAERKERAVKGEQNVDPKVRANILMCQGTFTAEQITKQMYPDLSVATVERIWREG